MGSNTIFGLIFLLFNTPFCPVSVGYRISLRKATQPRTPADNYDIGNETDFTQELLENNITNTTENDVLFWTVPDTKEAVEADTELHMDAEELKGLNNTFQASEDITAAAANDTIESQSPSEALKVDGNDDNKSNNDTTYNYVQDSEMEEKIVLQRHKCHLEVAVQETHDLKIQIKFGKLQNNTSGKCCITLNGEENISLGVLISNIYLYQNDSQGEVLKVIISNYGSDFVLKEYYPWTKYEPLILTETYRVYIVLYYKVANVPLSEQDSHFNLEVFRYHIYEKRINYGSTYYRSHFSHNALQNFRPAFAPYFY